MTPDKNETVSSAINLVNFSGISSGDYLMTQFGVITTYLRLLLVPVGQNLDYDYPLQQNFFTPQVLLPLSLLLLLLATACYLLKHSTENRLATLVSFGIFWFFITLSVESSIVPIEDLIFEQRAYLPSIGFFMALLAGSALIFKRLTRHTMTQSRLATVILVALVALLSAMTIGRNMVWQDDVGFWQDVISKSPRKARGYKWLGNTLVMKAMEVPDDRNGPQPPGTGLLLKEGSEPLMQAAIKAYNEGIRLEPGNANAYRSLAKALILQKNYDQALPALSKSIELEPKSGMSYLMRGEIFEARKDLVSARQEYLHSITVEPSYYLPHLNLAELYVKQGDVTAAIREVESALKIFPARSIRQKLADLQNR